MWDKIYFFWPLDSNRSQLLYPIPVTMDSLVTIEPQTSHTTCATISMYINVIVLILYCLPAKGSCLCSPSGPRMDIVLIGGQDRRQDMDQERTGQGRSGKNSIEDRIEDKTGDGTGFRGHGQVTGQV